MNLHLPLTLFGAAATVANAQLDVYIRETFETADGDSCDSCNVGDGCFLKMRAFFLQQSCFNRGYSKSSMYDEVDDGVVCRQDFPTSCGSRDIEFDAEVVDDCRDSWMIGECTDSERMTKLKKWCKEIDAPEGDYTVPLVSFQEFKELEDCGSPDYIHLLLPDEGGVCVSDSFRTSSDGGYITGSKQVYCNGNVYSAARYPSADCTGEALKLPVDESSDECPASLDSRYINTSNCGAPTVYCKASKEFSGSDPEESGVSSQIGDGVTAAENEGSTNAPGRLLGLAMVFLLLVA